LSSFFGPGKKAGRNNAITTLNLEDS